MSCMKEIGNAEQCPYCGYHVDSAQISPYLPVRTLVANRYLIGKLLDYNGEGATYMGWDISEKKAVNIREFFPDSVAMRTTTNLTLKVSPNGEGTFHDCNQSFLELWNKLMRLQGLSALINVTDVVEDFGTSYAVYDHIEGVTLREYLLSSKTGYIKWESAKQILMPILSTLGTLHSAGIIHRGISPSTLVIGRDGKVRITGFCIGQARTSSGELEAKLFPGYAAIEQYGFNGQQGPWTDVYSFGAVLYRTLVGSDPIDATERFSNDRLMVPGKIADSLPPYVLDGLVNALQILPEDRTRSVEQLRNELSDSPVTGSTYTKGGILPPINRPDTPAVPEEEEDEDEYEPEHDRKAERSIFAKSAGITILAGLIVFLGLVLTVFRDDFGISFGSSDEVSVTQNESGPNQVPNFKEKNYLDVISNPVFKALYNFEVQYVFSDSIAKNYVVSQSIPADSEVPDGTTITLYVSKGKEQVTVPENLVGQDFEVAYERLVKLGFEVDRKETTDGYYANNEVISVSPAPGSTQDKGTKITLKVYYTGEEETTIFTQVSPGLTDTPFFDDPGLDNPAGEEPGEEDEEAALPVEE